MPGSLGTSSGSSGASTAWPAHLGLGDLINFSEHESGFIFERSLHGFKVAFRIFAGAKFKAEIAQIVVNGVATLQQLIQFGAMRCEVGSIGLNVKDKNQRGDGESEARTQYGPIGGRDGIEKYSREEIH